MSQNRRLLSHLERGLSIDPMTALKALGIYRLGARIYDLKDSGHNIRTDIIEVKNRFGDVSRIANYSLEQRPAE
jgi:hypothetical protein